VGVRLRLLLILALAFPVHSARANLPIDPSQFSDPSQLLDQALVTTLVKTIAFYTDHRPMNPAEPLGALPGIELGIELSLVKMPEDLGPALENAGLSSGSSIPPSLPVPKLHLRKGLGRLDVGLSGIAYQGYLMVGADLQFLINQPEEGLTSAFRLGYNVSRIQIVTSETWTPAVIFSRQLDYFFPYIGLGYQMGSGTVTVTYTEPLLGQSITASKDGSAKSLFAMLGTIFRFGPSGIMLTLEGSYHQLGMATLGIKFGLRF
jgi:hypothetical protein